MEHLELKTLDGDEIDGFEIKFIGEMTDTNLGLFLSIQSDLIALGFAAIGVHERGCKKIRVAKKGCEKINP